MPSVLVYLARFERQGQRCQYVGATELKPGDTNKKALSRRRANLLEPPQGFPRVAWLRGVDAATLKPLERLQGPLSLADGLLEEAREAASRMAKEGGLKTTRGGPWCRCARNLPADDLAEIEAVAKCRSRAEVSALAQNSAGSLAAHVAQRLYGSKERWRGAKGAAVPTFATPDPLPRKRKPGRSGTPGNVIRKRHLKAGRYPRASRKHKRAKRGTYASRKRKGETARLAGKRRALKRPAGAW